MYTVHHKLGMFSKDVAEINPLVASDYSKAKFETPNVAPQDIWLSFLLRRFEVVKYYSKEQVFETDIWEDLKSLYFCDVNFLD